MVDKYKMILKEIELEDFVEEIRKQVEAKIDAETQTQIEDGKIEAVAEDVYTHQIYSGKRVVMGLNKALRDIRKTIIKAEKIIEGYYVGSQDQINPRKETEPSRQSVILYDAKAKELLEATVFGHGGYAIIDDAKSSEKGSFIFGRKYRLYCKIYEKYGTYTGVYMQELPNKIDAEKFYAFLESIALHPSELTREHLYKTIVISSEIRYAAPLEIRGEDKSQPKKDLVIGGETQYDTTTGLAIKVHPIIDIGNYPLASGRLDDNPSLPSFTGRIKLWREDTAEGDEDIKNYTELMFYPQRLGQTRVSLAGLNELIVDDNILECPPEEQLEIFSDEVLQREILAVGKLSQFNKDNKNQPINWVKINTILMIDNKEMNDSLEDISVDPVTNSVVDDVIYSGNYGDLGDDKLNELRAILSDTSVTMIGETNYDELLKTGRLDKIEWLDDSYRSIVNDLLKEEGRYSL